MALTRPGDEPPPQPGDVPPLRPALFLDRDGVLNRDRDDFVKRLDEFELFPQAVRAVAELSRAGLTVVVVSNQSGIARGLLTLPIARAMTDALRAAVEAEGGRIAGVYLCPHGPQDGCACRKPLPGLLQRAATELNLDLSRSVMVGDSLRDLQAGAAAGCAATLLLLSGKTPAAPDEPWRGWPAPPTRVAADLSAGTTWLLERLTGASLPPDESLR